jgi:hypothetical protein
MSSAWGKSWSSNWNNSWGVITVVTVAGGYYVITQIRINPLVAAVLKASEVVDAILDVLPAVLSEKVVGPATFSTPSLFATIKGTNDMSSGVSAGIDVRGVVDADVGEPIFIIDSVDIAPAITATIEEKAVVDAQPSIEPVTGIFTIDE